MLQVENARALGWSWPCTHGSRPRPDQTPSRGPPQMPAGKPASQAEEPDDPAAAPTAVPAVAGRTPARRIPHLAPPVSPCMLKSAGALSPRPQGASRQLRRRRAAHARPRRHEPGGRATPVGGSSGRPADAAKSTGRPSAKASNAPRMSQHADHADLCVQSHQSIAASENTGGSGTPRP